MKVLPVMAALGLGALGLVGAATAQPYGGRGDYGYDRGDYGRDRGDYGYRDRGDYGRDRDYDRGPRGGRGDYAFDEQEYLRCNPDVRRAVVNGQVPSGLAHYRKFGIREGRRLSC